MVYGLRCLKSTFLSLHMVVSGGFCTIRITEVECFLLCDLSCERQITHLTTSSVMIQLSRLTCFGESKQLYDSQLLQWILFLLHSDIIYHVINSNYCLLFL